MQKIIVEPVDRGWTVNIETVDNPMMFASGRAAEDAARDLALRLAAGGTDVALELRLRGGERAARFVVLAPVEHEQRPLMLNVSQGPGHRLTPLRPEGGGTTAPASPRVTCNAPAQTPGPERGVQPWGCANALG